MSAPNAIKTRRQRPLGSATLLAVAALIVVLAGCGGTAKFEDEPVRVFPPLPTAPATTQTPRTTAAGRIPSSTTTTALATTTTRRRTVPTSATTTTQAPVSTLAASDQTILRAALGRPGGAAGVILQPNPATSLVVEVMEEPGAAANSVALNRVLSDLRRYSGKTVTEVHTVLPNGSPSKRWTEETLEELADRSQTIPQGRGRFVLRILSVRGQNVRSGGILAESFRGDTIATFPDRYASAGQPLITAVIVHEVGHILGLVDLYLDRGRADTVEDPAGEGHSRNRSSVMYWAVDPSALGAIFGTASNRFDGEDERDLAAIRAGAALGSNPR